MPSVASSTSSPGMRPAVEPATPPHTAGEPASSGRSDTRGRLAHSSIVGASAASPSTLDLPAALARVLGMSSASHVRGDTPLAGMGVDSLALLCLSDLIADDGWTLDSRAARQAATVHELSCCIVAST